MRSILTATFTICFADTTAGQPPERYDNNTGVLTGKALLQALQHCPLPLQVDNPHLILNP